MPTDDTNLYAAPAASLLYPAGADGENTSGVGKGHPVPAEVPGWSWGAFLLNWVWAIGNSTWIGLFALTPYLGFIMAFVLGRNGREWAWQNKRWDSVEHFNRVQRRWSQWAVGMVAGTITLMLPAGFLLPRWR